MLKTVKKLRKLRKVVTESQGRIRDRTETLPCYSTKMWGSSELRGALRRGDRLSADEDGRVAVPLELIRVGT